MIRSLVCAVLSLTPLISQAALSDVDISVARQKLDESKSKDGITLVKSKDIAYDVTIKSKTFKPLENLEVKYMIFYENPEAGATEQASETSHRGVEKIAVLEGNRSVTFTTTPLTLTTESLPSGWSYTSGASSKSRDRTKGVWIRVYSEGKIIGEYANPSTVLKRDWKD